MATPRKNQNCANFMNRYSILILALATVQVSLKASDGPNVLFIAVDDLACTLGCYGDKLAHTPNLDRLAATGVCFHGAYNQLPLCNPTRASIMTGLRPDTIKVYDLDRHFRDEVPDVVTLPQAFQNHGYVATRVGKIYHYNVPASIGTDGFDDPPSWNKTINPKGRDKKEEDLITNAEPHRKISAALSWLAADGTDQEQTDGMIASAAMKFCERRMIIHFSSPLASFDPIRLTLLRRSTSICIRLKRYVCRIVRKMIERIFQSLRSHIIARFQTMDWKR